MLRRSLFPAAIGLLATPAIAQLRQGPPHEWMYGSWSGGIFPAVETVGPGCFGAVALIVTRDVIMRVSSLEIAFRQRAIETVALTPDGLEFRLVPLGGRPTAETGFGCNGNPDLLRVSRRNPDEVVLPGCVEFPSLLRRCKTS